MSAGSMLLENFKNLLEERYGNAIQEDSSVVLEQQKLAGQRFLDFNYGFISYKLEGDAVVIYTIYTRPEYRRKGFTRKAVEMIESLAIKHNKKVSLGLFDYAGTNRDRGLNTMKSLGYVPYIKDSKCEVYIKGVS